MKKSRKSGKGVTPNDQRKAMGGTVGRLKKPARGNGRGLSKARY